MTDLTRDPRRWTIGLLLAATLGWWPADATAQRLSSNIDGDVRPSQVQDEMAEVDAKLRRGKWRAALAHTERLTETVLGRTWHGRELPAIVAELALYHALAEADLDRREPAIWHWHIAQNLDFRIAKRDLAPYGKAGKLLYEHPLRSRGEVPAPFVVPDHYPGGPPYEGPRRPEMKSVPEVVNNAGAAQEGSGDFQVELLIDEQGEVHQPVVISSHLHPIIIYASLEWLRRLPAFTPARFEGEPADALETITVKFQVSRW
jgi:Gram-negative bacterial TonB protein C-terminal